LDTIYFIQNKKKKKRPIGIGIQHFTPPNLIQHGHPSLPHQHKNHPIKICGDRVTDDNNNNDNRWITMPVQFETYPNSPILNVGGDTEMAMLEVQLPVSSRLVGVKKEPEEGAWVFARRAQAVADEASYVASNSAGAASIVLLANGYTGC
jgi:hypothetical protein